MILIGCMLGICAGPVAARPSKNVRAERSATLPDRYLQCILGRSTNIDPGKRQTTADIISEGQHHFVLRLPPIAVHVGDPPDPTDPPEPVDARTRIIADPDGIARGVGPAFSRVADLWPKRVEMIAPIANSTWTSMIIVDPIDRVKGRAHLFMTRVKDAATMDLAHIYQGECQVSNSNAQTTAR